MLQLRSRSFSRQIGMSVGPGNIRAADKLFRAEGADTHICQVCDVNKQTSHHFWWECPGYAEVHKPFLDKRQKLRDTLCARHPRKLAELDMVIDTAAWRCCGACVPACIAFNPWRMLDKVYGGLLPCQHAMNLEYSLFAGVRDSSAASKAASMTSHMIRTRCGPSNSESLPSSSLQVLHRTAQT